ncbi:uncharacterized protein LOC127086721 [Lathyrus oleraceus]|uniref:uncharacterized protein LOC127086721 n=1 Tax=Pisum sativum TaxID=3888 RepID=UPI0021D155BD|nr:uncharacterized protein LOC127086721 [Pisum sativum]
MGDKPITFIEKYSEVLQGRRIPIKQKDPGAVIISWNIENKNFKKVLINSGASVSLMSMSIYQKLGIGKVSNTGTNLKFADPCIKHAYGIVEDILVTIEEFSFPVDFVIMDMPENKETPIILGRPFLLTSQCNINVEKCILTIKAYDDKITLDVLENRKHEGEKGNHYQVGMIKTCVKISSQRPPQEKVSRKTSQMVSSPLGTMSEKILDPFQNPREKRKSGIEVRL